MNKFVILGTGQSLNQEQIDYIKDKAKVIAISNSYKLAPWADYLVSYDSAWWRNNPEALRFPRTKYCYGWLDGTTQIRPLGMPVGCNSGLYGMYIAKELGATEIILLGFDMHGTHYFGRHPEPLKNTTAIRFRQHLHQFKRWDGPQVINCTPESALTKFKIANIKDVI